MIDFLLTLAQTAAPPSPFGGPGQLSEEEAGIIALIFGAVGCVGLLVGLAIMVVVIILLIKPLQKIPQHHRKIEPGMVWLLLIPLFNLVWNFFVYPRISQSFQSYFAEKGRTDVGDCGHAIGLALAICAALTWIPYAGCVVTVAVLVLLILYLVKIHGLANMIDEGNSAAPPAPPAQTPPPPPTN